MSANGTHPIQEITHLQNRIPPSFRVEILLIPRDLLKKHVLSKSLKELQSFEIELLEFDQIYLEFNQISPDIYYICISISFLDSELNSLLANFSHHKSVVLDHDPERTNNLTIKFNQIF